jgi:hypothetical protein
VNLVSPANEDHRGGTAGRRHLARLIVAAVLMGAIGVLLVVTGVWALTFEGSISRALRRTLNGHTLTSLGVLLLVVGLVSLACVVGVLIGPKVNRWVGLTACLVAIVIGVVLASTGIWLVAHFPGWAITYTALGVLAAFTLTSYERELHASWPWAPLRAQAAKVFALNTQGVNVPRGIALAGLALITLVVTSSLDQERYFLSVTFGLLF